MWWIIDHDVKTGITERHPRIVSNNRGAVTRVDVYANNWPLAASPKPAPIDGSVQNSTWSLSGIERKQAFDQFCVLSVPH